MSLSNAPTGLSAVTNTVSASWMQNGNVYYIPSTDNNAYGIGSVVRSDNGSDANGVAKVILAAATEVPRGVVMGVFAANVFGQSLQGTSLSLETIAIPATKARDYYVLVLDDPNTVWEVQCDNATALVAGSTIGLNAKLVVGAPSGISPYATTVLDSANIATTNTFMVKILGMSTKPGNDFSAYTRLLVRFNAHDFFGLTTGAV